MFEKKPVIFKCRLSAKNLETNITWYKDGKPIGDTHRTYKITAYRWGSRLRIRRARAGDAGTFQCVVEGPGGTVTAKATLKINPLVNTPPIASTVIEFSLHCLLSYQIRFRFEHLRDVERNDKNASEPDARQFNLP